MLGKQARDSKFVTSIGLSRIGILIRPKQTLLAMGHDNLASGELLINNAEKRLLLLYTVPPTGSPTSLNLIARLAHPCGRPTSNHDTMLQPQ